MPHVAGGRAPLVARRELAFAGQGGACAMALARERDSDLGMFFGATQAVGKVLRGKRGAFIADENVTPLRPAARAKAFPAPAAPNEGPHFVPRLTAERTSAPRHGGSGHLGGSIHLRVSLGFTGRYLEHFLGRQFGRESVPISKTKLSCDYLQACAVGKRDVSVDERVSKRFRHCLGIFLCEHGLILHSRRIIG